MMYDESFRADFELYSIRLDMKNFKIFNISKDLHSLLIFEYAVSAFENSLLIHLYGDGTVQVSILLLVHLYDDDTIQVSILYECSLLIDDDTRFHCYLMCDLYRCVNHMTHANLMRSGYLPTYLIDKTFCPHTAATLKKMKSSRSYF